MSGGMEHTKSAVTGEGNAPRVDITNIDEVIEASGLAPHTFLFAVAKMCEKRAQEAKKTRICWPDCLLHGIWSRQAVAIEQLAKDILHGKLV